MATELFRPKYAPAGYKYRDAKAAGVLRQSETWFIRVRHDGRTVRESTKTNNKKEARAFLAEFKAKNLKAGERYNKDAKRVTFQDMAECLKRDYDTNGKDRPTLDARLKHLLGVFGDRRMASITPDDVEEYVRKRRESATNGTINRELELLARAFSLGRKLRKLTAPDWRVRDHRLQESAPRSGFFERDQFSAVLRHLTRMVVREADGRQKKVRVPADDLRLACSLAYTYGWRMQSEILTLE
jgi:hypothetical protein